MGKLLEGVIARQVAKGLKRAGLTKAAVLIKVTEGARTDGDLAGGKSQVETSFKARGLVPKTRREKINGTLVEQDDRVILILGATIAKKQVPTTKDKLTFDGITSPIMAVEVDAANATYLCLTRA